MQFDCIQMSCDQNEIKSNTAEIDLNLEKAERDFAEKLQADESEKGRSCMEGMNAKEKVAPDTPVTSSSDEFCEGWSEQRCQRSKCDRALQRISPDM